MTYAAQIRTLVDAMIQNEAAPMLPLIKRVRDNECPPETRLSVYTRGYLLRLEDAVTADYPALKQYLGKEAFERAAVAYVRATPSTFWDLNLYSIGFAEFMKSYSDDAAAQALAAVESALIEVYWAEDSDPLDAKTLASITMDALAARRFTLRTACALLELKYSANAYFTAFRQEQAPTTIEKTPEYLCILRHDNQLQRLVLEAEEYTLLTALARKETFGKALEIVHNPEVLAAKLPGYLTRWLTAGIFAE